MLLATSVAVAGTDARTTTPLASALPPFEYAMRYSTTSSGAASFAVAVVSGSLVMTIASEIASAAAAGTDVCVVLVAKVATPVCWTLATLSTVAPPSGKTAARLTVNDTVDVVAPAATLPMLQVTTLPGP